MMQIRCLLIIPLLLALAGLRLNGAHAETRKPNVLVILTDDQGWGDLSAHGNTNLSTPHLDALATGGATFERFFVSPVCSPTRAEFLTGRYHPRTGVSGVSSGRERMNLDETTIADVFKAAGYATANFGKWHNGTQYPYHPNGRGFDEFYGFTSGHWGDYFSPPLDHNGHVVRGNGYTTDDFTDRTIAFIEQQRDHPFFVYLTYNTPHSPMQVPDRWWNKFKNKELALRGTEPERENLDHTRAALAMCENIDWNVGRLLARLDELELSRDTIIVYFCDNGPNGHRFNGSLKGIKGSTDEGGVRSPLFIRWPHEINAGTRVPVVAGAIDLFPTLAALARVPLDHHTPLDGKNLAPLFRLSKEELENGRAIPPDLRERLIFSHWGARISVRNSRFRLDHTGKLYDLIADPGQQIDVSKRYPDVAQQLAIAVEAWKRDVLRTNQQDKRPFLVGYASSKSTQLPARDARARGNILRSSPHPNCSFFTDWTSTADRITWDVEVAASGTYEVEIYYTCPPTDVGSTIELRLNSSRLRGRIIEAHDPPLYGAQHDRVPRTESYMKDFRPLNLGTVELAAGRGELTLRAPNIPGSQAMDFYMLVLTRVAKE
jgi:arylsulfatase A-like enzyme